MLLSLIAWGNAWSDCLWVWVCCLWSWSLFWAIILITTMLTLCFSVAWLMLTTESRGESDLGGVLETGGGDTDMELLGDKASFPLE